MRYAVFALITIAVAAGAGVQAYSRGFDHGMRRAESVLQPHGVVVQREDGSCEAHLGQSVDLQLDKPYRAQFVTFLWPGLGSAK